MPTQISSGPEGVFRGTLATWSLTLINCECKTQTLLEKGAWENGKSAIPR